MGQVNERLKEADWNGLARLVQRLSGALLTNSYREQAGDWEADDEGEARTPDVLPPSVGRGQSRRPYFEVLMVSPAERKMWPGIRDTFRRLRREEDRFVYEPVVVGSFEDAVLAAIFNYNLQSVVISDGFAFNSQYAMPGLREAVARNLPAGAGPGMTDMGSALAKVIRMIRPELDVFLMTDRDVAKLAGSDAAADLRRVFYGVEEPMEIHLAILDGINDRYDTPYFDNLKNYAARPIGTFHALPRGARQVDLQVELDPRHGRVLRRQPVPRRIVSATTGGLDSLLEPTGNIKVAQDKAARAFGGDRTSSSSPTAPRPPTRSCTRRWCGRATSC